MTQASPPRRKVLYLVTKSNFGGAQRYVYDLATGLPHEKFEPVVAFGPGPDGTPGVLSARLQAAGIRTILVPVLARDVGFSDVRACAALWKLLREECPAELHLNSSKAAGIGALVARLAGFVLGGTRTHIIFTVHGWPFWEDRTPIAKGLIFFFSYLTVLLSHVTICISEHDSRAMARMPFAARKLTTIRNGVTAYPLSARTDARHALLSDTDITAHEHDLWVVSVGELTANKDYETALAAIAAYNQTATQKAFYCIISDGEERAALEHRAQELGISTHVRFLGFVPDASSEFLAFDVFLLTSKKEGVPYVILEAGLAGIPVVASRVGAISEVIEHDVDGLLVPSGDANAVCDALARLAQDDGVRSAFGAALAQKVRACYELTHMRLETYKLY